MDRSTSGTELAVIQLTVDLAERLHVALWGATPNEVDRDLFAETLDVRCANWLAPTAETCLEELRASATPEGFTTSCLLEELVTMIDDVTFQCPTRMIRFAETTAVSRWVEERFERNVRCYERTRAAQATEQAAAAR